MHEPLNDLFMSLDAKFKSSMWNSNIYDQIWLTLKIPPFLIVFRDLKTGNCLVDEYRRVKVSDFGTAVTKEKMGTELVGTGNSLLGLTMVAAYMPPERLREEQSDEKTDVFSFGVMLWELMLRKIPWEGLTNIQVEGYSATWNKMKRIARQSFSFCFMSLNFLSFCVDDSVDCCTSWICEWIIGVTWLRSKRVSSCSVEHD